MKKIIIILVVVAIVIVSGIYLIPSKPVNDNPEDSYRTFIQNINDAEAVEATDLTIWKFSPPEEYDETVELYGEIGLLYQIETHELAVIHSDEMAQNYNLEMQNISQKFENDFNITIDDYCYLNMSRTINYYTGETEYMGYSNMGCLQVDGLWYLCRFDYYGEQ